MGWLFMSSLGQYASPKAYLDAQYTFQNADGTSQILASALVKMRTWYAACRQIDHATGKAHVFALVCLVKYNPRDREGVVFGYKDMSESMGPCESECPASILDLLTPTTSEYAQAWRARCRATATRRSRLAPKDGDTIIFAAAISFTDGSEARRFIIRIEGRKRIFTNPASGSRYRISRWKDRECTIIPKMAPKIDLARGAA
jgi:hypothetical protein